MFNQLIKNLFMTIWNLLDAFIPESLEVEKR
jgi:hypothetical protein